jgi:hypothetical protein
MPEDFILDFSRITSNALIDHCLGNAHGILGAWMLRAAKHLVRVLQ